MTVWEFEDAVSVLERIQIVIWAPHGVDVEGYTCERADGGNCSLATFLDTSVQPFIGDREVIVFNGARQPAHGAAHLSTIRNSYRR